MVTSAGAALAQSPTPDAATSGGSVVLGGRIEVPSAGFVLEVPEGWYAFDLSASDLLAEMESFDQVTAMLAPQMASFSIESLAPAIAEAVPDAALPLVAFAPFDGPTAGENCVVVVEPMDTELLEVMVAMELMGMRMWSDIEGVAPRFIDRPTGRLAMAEYATPYPAAGELERTVFFLLHDGRGYSMTCTDASRHADRWLSIAESVEFLPAEE